MATSQKQTEVSELIAGGAPLALISKGAGGMLPAMKIYSENRAATFSVQREFTDCCSCGTHDDLKVVKVVWKGTYTTPWVAPFMAVAIFLHVAKESSTQFETYHAFCAKCESRFFSTRRIAAALSTLGLLLIFGALWGIPLYVGINSIGDERFNAHLWYGIGSAAVIVGAILLMSRPRNTSPSELASLKRRPFDIMTAFLLKA